MEHALVHPMGAGVARLNRTLWTLQALLCGIFGASGVLKLALPMDRLTNLMTWPGLITGDFAEQLVRLNGAAELLGALGMVLPGLTRRMPHLTAWAGYGLLVVMIMAAGFHLSHSGIAMLPANIVLGAMAGYVGWGRSGPAPLPGN